MNVNLMAAISLVVIISLFVVLVGYLRKLTRLLVRTGSNLEATLSITTDIRGHCEQISPGVDAMNTNLYGVAAGLSMVGDAAEERATRC